MMTETSTDRLYRVALSGKEFGEFTMAELQDLWRAGQLDAETLYLHPVGQWKPLREVMGPPKGFRSMRTLHASTGPRLSTDERKLVKTQRLRGIYMVLALFLGGFGIHNFYSGRIWSAVLQLLLTMSSFLLILPVVFVWMWAIIECFMVMRDGQGDPLG